MKILDIKNNYQKVLAKAAKVIKAGGLVVLPSDTVYGLAVDPTSKKGVKKLLVFKNRWTGKAISIAVINKEMAMEYVKINKNGENIYANLLPGPFTIISEGKHRVEKGIEAENGTLGIRIPDNKCMIDLIRLVGGPITATSANLSGRRPNYSITSFLRPLSTKKKEMIDLIVDAGKLPKNKPSTVIDITESEIKILRRGDLVTGSVIQTFISKSEKETEKIAEFLLHKSLKQNPSVLRTAPLDKREQSLKQKPIVFLLSGDLGCGKTVFSRKIGKLLGVKEKITSPTFVIYSEYKTLTPYPFPLTGQGEKVMTFLHMDLYKITTERDLEEIKFLDLFSKNTIGCIEWPENMGRKMLEKLKKKVNLILINFEYKNANTRQITIKN